MFFLTNLDRTVYGLMPDGMFIKESVLKGIFVKLSHYDWLPRSYSTIKEAQLTTELCCPGENIIKRTKILRLLR